MTWVMRTAPAVLLILLTSTLGAAQVSVGTTPGAPTEAISFVDELLFNQSFVVPRNAAFLSRLTFGVHVTDDLATYTDFWLSSTLEGMGDLFTTTLVEGQNGIDFGRSIRVTPGAVMYFGMVSGTNWPYVDEYNDGAPGGATYVDFTTAEAYADGTAYSPFDPIPYDAVFSATFTTTPEPISIVLLATGLLGLGAVGWRRRSTREA